MDNNIKKSINVTARKEHLKEVLSFIHGEMREGGLLMTSELELAVEEIFLNIASYAYPEGEGDVTVSIKVCKEPNIASITFIDSGIPFDPGTVPKPNIDLPIKERNIGGLGIFMVEQIMDSITYCYKEGRNVLTLFKELSEDTTI